MANPTSEEARAIYDQDCNFYRYQDGLRWGRFKVATTIEAAFLYAGYNVDGLSDLQRLVVVFFGVLLVSLLIFASNRDAVNSNAHLDRMKIFENEIRPYKKNNGNSVSGKNLVMCTSWLIAIFNFTVIIDRLWPFL